MISSIITKFWQRHSTVGSRYRGGTYHQGMSRLMNDIKVGDVVLVSYADDNCTNGISSLDIECTFEDIFDELGYDYETVYSDDSMLVWFGVETSSPQIIADEMASELRKLKYLTGLSVGVGKQTFIV